jgi:hypothetical protein
VPHDACAEDSDFRHVGVSRDEGRMHYPGVKASTPP